MHDIRLLRDQLEHLRDGMRRRGKLAELGPMLDRAESLERERRTAITELEAQQARRNKVTAEVGQRRKAGEDATALMAEGRAIGEQIALLEQRRAETLHHAAAHLRRVVLKESRIRQSPRLRFVLDDSLKRAAELEAAMRAAAGNVEGEQADGEDEHTDTPAEAGE